MIFTNSTSDLQLSYLVKISFVVDRGYSSAGAWDTHLGIPSNEAAQLCGKCQGTPGHGPAKEKLQSRRDVNLAQTASI